MDSKNLPAKQNFKGAKGLDALLGASNFDVCEYIILKSLEELRREPMQLAMLCKTQVARNVIEHAAAAGLPVTDARIYRIDAKKWFGALVDACLFVISSGPGVSPDYTVAVFEDLFEPGAAPTHRFGVVDGRLVADVDAYLAVREADGTSPHVWRSGLKHDASAIFELDATFDSGSNEPPLGIEAGYVFPLLKCTDIFRGNDRTFRKWVIVPQKTFGADTRHLETVAPNLWAYLTSNATLLDARKSSIYRNRPRFSVFGHGDYTYAPYKVAVSGLHKRAVFRLIAPLSGRPVVLDDTCYFLPFDNSTDAAMVTAQMNSPEAQLLIESLVFWDSKRPITKKLLARIDIERLPRDELALKNAARALADEAGLSFDEPRADEWLRKDGVHAGMITLF